MEPTFDDYVALIYNRFEAFVQGSVSSTKTGHPYVYENQGLILFFMWMQFKRIYKFKSQWCWLNNPQSERERLGWKTVPHRTTLSRRYKTLYGVVQEFIEFLGQQSAPLGEELRTQHLCEDQSLFKAQGSVWHQSDRKAGRIPEKLRHLDTDGTWAKSGYHGWVYGYGLHLTNNQAGFPVLVEVETAAFSEKEALIRKEPKLLQTLKPDTVAADDAYTGAKRIRAWAKAEVILLTPALRWRNGRYAQAYKRFIAQPEINLLLRQRKTAIEPIFDLIGKLLGVTVRQKQLAIQSLPNVRTHLGLAVLSLQIAMLANNIWGLPFRSISTIRAVFA